MINAEQLKEFLGCDDKFLSELMLKFIDESGEGVKRLRTASEAGNWPLVKATAHKMLSSTRIFNMGELSDTLEEIEVLAEEQKHTEQIPEKVNVITSSWKEVVAEIHALLPGLAS